MCKEEGFDRSEDDDERTMGWQAFNLVILGPLLLREVASYASKSKGVNSTTCEDRVFVRFYDRRTGHTRPMSGRGSGQGSVSYSWMIRIQDL